MISEENKKMLLYETYFDTQLGEIIAVADEQVLYLVDFVNRPGLERKIEKIKQTIKFEIVPGRTIITNLIESELQQYFAGTLKIFTTPMHFLGSPFQQLVWSELQKIPHGQTISYAQLAIAIGNRSACRAVAQANGKNHLSLIIPCHRVINSDGQLGGYGGGINRKEWLLNHERKQTCL